MQNGRLMQLLARVQEFSVGTKLIAETFLALFFICNVGMDLGYSERG